MHKKGRGHTDLKEDTKKRRRVQKRGYEEKEKDATKRITQNGFRRKETDHRAKKNRPKAKG